MKNIKGTKLWKTGSIPTSAADMLYGTKTKKEKDKENNEYIYKNLNE